MKVDIKIISSSKSLYSCPGLNLGERRLENLPQKMIASRRSTKMRVVCTLEFVLGFDIDGDMEVGSLGGRDRFARES